MNKNSVQIQIAKQLPITLGSKILIDDHSVAIHEAIMCGGVTTIRGYLGNKNQMNIDNLATQTPEEEEALDSIKPVHLRDYQKVDKPHVKVKYEKVTESIFDLREEFERGELHYDFGDEDWFTFNDEASLVAGFKEGNVYRRIETAESQQQREERERLEATKAPEIEWIYGDECSYNDISWWFCGFHPASGLAIIANRDAPDSHQVITVDASLLSKINTKRENAKLELSAFLWGRNISRDAVELASMIVDGGFGYRKESNQ